MRSVIVISKNLCRNESYSWRVDEAYVKIKGAWMYLYRAVDTRGNTLEFLLSATRDAQAAKRFLRKRSCPPTR
ncbi:hypothetical protein KSB_38170 [Ktedonobacter robiniae]|uniref:DDE domain-containing protein n=1 Tax=Ktedonobacter robiniae TaxID=2778365 RepID=A0ABQ3URL9_9CHLR|nr:hypothetical protein KSB_38170 [Ktedonobacter robiniae]